VAGSRETAASGRDDGQGRVGRVLVDEALSALLARHRAVEIDAAYAA
jgi:hypothetical protein